jgi:hypothetical protein
MELYLHSPNTPSWRGAKLSTGTTLNEQSMSEDVRFEDFKAMKIQVVVSTDTA